MSAKSYWLRYWHRLQVRQRATLYQLYNQLPRDQAYAAAARDIADAQRAERQDRRKLKAEKGNTLLTSVLGLLERMHPDDEPARTTPSDAPHAAAGVNPTTVRKRVSDPTLEQSYPIGIFGNASPSGATLLGDEQFAPRFHDRTTHNWRMSISENERIERERREHWAKRLAEMKAEGTA
jgi:hypothetical protein